MEHFFVGKGESVHKIGSRRFSAHPQVVDEVGVAILLGPGLVLAVADLRMEDLIIIKPRFI